MCGIVGYVGNKNAQEHLINGLSKLEYRGYDSAGIATMKGSQIKVFKEKGRIEDLKNILGPNDATMGIGHTRWATHGPATTANAHPHRSETERFVLVHNGIIENFESLKKEYLQDVSLRSDTDTEIVVQLLEKMALTTNSTSEAFRLTLTKLKGSYAIAMIDLENEGTVYAAKNKSPLLIGTGNGENMVASDAMAVIHLTDQFIELEDGEMAFLTANSISHYKISGEKVERAPFKAEIDPSDLEKGTYQHYMLKETDEQPAVIRRIIKQYSPNGSFEIDEQLKEDILASERLFIVACGTSYHAGLVGQKLIQKLTQIPTEVHVASEFTQDPPMMNDKSFAIFISQSGETADSREALQMVRRRGIKTLTITNVKGSTLSREADHTLLLYAGPEIAVASTKAYTAQIAVMSIMAEVLRQKKGLPTHFNLQEELSKIAQGMEQMVDQQEEFEKIAREYLEDVRSCFFIGRTVDYNVCLEGALKLKEISYIQAEGFAGGELKHGTIALIEEGTPIIVPITSEDINLMIRSNVQEVNARGAKSCILAMDGLEQEGDRYILPKTHSLLSPLMSIVPMQLISYYAALQRGCDIDKPKNLAKSVTVQ